MNVRVILLVIAVAGIVGCGKKEEAEKPQAPIPEAAVPAPAPAPAEKVVPEPATPALVLTPEMESAVVCVQVGTKEMLQREHAGVLLRPEALTPPVPGDSKARVVAVLLPKFDDAALRSKSCEIKVMRNKFDLTGVPYVILHPGTLLHFDERTHVALVQFAEDFPYRLESGYAADTPAGAEGPVSLLQAGYKLEVEQSLRQRQQGRMVEIQRSVSLGKALGGAVELALLPAEVKGAALVPMLAGAQPPHTGTAVLHSAPVLSSTGAVVGFAQRGMAANWEFQAFAMPVAPVPIQEVAAAPAESAPPPAPIMPGPIQPPPSVDLPAQPFPNGLRGPGGGRGFRPEPPKAVVAEAGRKEVSTESRILHGLPICEGREVLFRLEGAPFWKRLSLADGRWLPLPAEDLSVCQLTGNKEAIFVLQPATGELKRYDAKTLTLEKTATLPAGLTYRAVAAGCLSDDTPVAVIVDGGALACDARELTPGPSAALQERKKDLNLTPAHYYLASGDGALVCTCIEGETQNSHGPHFQYAGALRGFVSEGISTHDVMPTVSASCPWDRHDGIRGPRDPEKRGVQRERSPFDKSGWGPLACSPNFFDMRRLGTGASPAQCSLYSYHSTEPWATVDVPEAASVKEEKWSTFCQRVWLDPEALTLAVWHGEKEITLHTLDRAKLPTPKTPVLLNYPDCFAARGADFHFSPRLLGGAAQITTAEVPAGFVTGADGTMDWHVPPTSPLEEEFFAVKIAGGAEQPGACQFWMSVRLGGMQPVLAVSAAAMSALRSQNADKWPPAGKGGIVHYTSMEAKAKNREAAMIEAVRNRAVLPLNSRLYVSDQPIDHVESGLTDYVALRMKDKSLALFSVRDWKVAGTLPVDDTSAVFMAGDSVLSYSTITRMLTRHALPDFKVTDRLQMPPQVKLAGLGVGEQPAGPVTLLLDAEVAGMKPSLMILDKQTLTATKWAPYTTNGNGFWITSAALGARNFPLPLPLPTSSDGRLVKFGRDLLMISATLTTECDSSFTDIYLPPPAKGQPPVSMDSGLPVIDRMFTTGNTARQLHNMNPMSDDARVAVLSHCGNYYACPRSDDARQINLYATDDARLLLSLTSVDLLKFSDGGQDSERRNVVPMGEKNLLTVLSWGGYVLQVLHLDLAATSTAVQPNAAYVTSYPFPIVTEGRMLDYTFTLSNPAAISTCELREKIPGAAVTNQGRFTYRAPTKLERTMLIHMTILIRLRGGEKAEHHFPIYVVPAPKPAGKKDAAK